MFQALRYEEEFSSALKSLGVAQSLEPTWEEARTQEQDLVSWLSSVCELLQNKGRVREKKIQQMLQVNLKRFAFKICYQDNF